jgi:hypothetical protein
MNATNATTTEQLPTRYGTQDVSGIGMKPKSGSHTDQYTGLRVSSITQEHHDRTCGYWYLVSAGAMAHTAFADRDHLIQWMENRGLSLLGELAMAGTYSTVGIEGTYRRTAHLSYDEFYSLDGKRIRILDNADYTLGVITEDEDGIANIHHLNCNLRDRMVFDYTASRKLIG